MSEPEDPSPLRNTVDNRGATIAHQVLVQGNATFGVTSDGDAIHRRSDIIDFAAERGRHTCFFGREDVLAEMDAWIDARESGWLLVTGGPGLGKSALLDRWARGREAGQPIAVHFIRRGHKDWADPSRLRTSLAAQIEVMFPAQRDPDADPAYRLEQLLERVSPVLAERDDRLVLLVDGLDEAMTLGKGSPIPDIFPLEVPARVFVVTASRPQYPHLGWFDRRNGPSSRLDLDAHAESNEEAVREYWSVLGKAMEPPLSAALIQAAVEGAQGNLLHAVKLHQLWSAAGAERSGDAVPRGLAGMLYELWRRIEELPKEQRKLARQGLSLICAARESLPLRVVEKLLDWDEGDAQADFLPLVREMLLEELWRATPAYRPFHERLREVVEERLGDTLAEDRKVLAEYASWPSVGDEFRRSYALRHRVEHRVETGDVDAAASACMDLDFLTAKACIEGVAAVERDIRLAAEARQDDKTHGRLLMLGRLVAASAHWAGEVPEALPALLHDRALTNAPELLGELLGSAHSLPKHPRLRHPLQSRGMSRILQGHQGEVTAVAVLPDGRIVSGSLDKTLRVWDVQTGRTLATLEGHNGSVTALAVLPDGRVVSGSNDQTLRVWDVQTGRTLATLEGHNGSVTALAVLPGGRVVSGSADGTLRVWYLQTGEPLAILEGPFRGVTALAMLPDGRVVSGSWWSGTLQVWNMQTGHTFTTLQRHIQFHVRALAAFSDGHVIFDSRDNKLRVSEVETDHNLATLEGHTDWVTAVAVLPGGRVISGSYDKTLRVWDVESGRNLATLRGHTSKVNALAVLPDGRVVSGAGDKSLRVWDVQTARTLVSHEGHTRWVTALAVLPGGRVVSGSADGTLRVWDMQSGHTLATLECHARVTALAVLPDGRAISGSSDLRLRVWDVQTCRTLATLEGHTDQVTALVVLPDGRVVSSSDDKTLRLWDVQTGRALATLLGHASRVKALAVLPDGRIVSGSDDKTLRVWDLQTRGPLGTLEGHTHGVKALAVLPDGRVVSGSDDTTLRVWDLRTGRTLVILEGHTHGVNALAVLPDGRVVSGSDDKTLRVWDVQTGRTFATVYADASFISIACVDQRLIVAGDNLGNVWFIDLPEM